MIHACTDRLCGADDCPTCHPGIYPRCPSHGFYEGEECQKCVMEEDRYERRER